jgi:hypothetical protein
MAVPPISFVRCRETREVSGGTSNLTIYEMVERALIRRNIRGGCLVDVGCGTGNLYAAIGRRFDRYIGVIRYEGFPEEVDFVLVELNSGNVPLPDGKQMSLLPLRRVNTSRIPELVCGTFYGSLCPEDGCS